MYIQAGTGRAGSSLINEQVRKLKSGAVWVIQTTGYDKSTAIKRSTPSPPKIGNTACFLTCESENNAPLLPPILHMYTPDVIHPLPFPEV